MLLTNSANRLKYFNWVLDQNEDWDDANTLGERFGISFAAAIMADSRAQVQGDHPLMEGVRWLEMIEGNGITFDVSSGETLASASGEPAVVLVQYGESGEVLVLADVGMLGAADEPVNLTFWLNLARYARSR